MSIVATQLQSDVPSYVVAPTGCEVIRNQRADLTDTDQLIGAVDSIYRDEAGESDTWASFIFVQRADESVLMLKTIRNPQIWMPVGGRNDRDDVDPAATAVRELAEEISISATAKSMELLEVAPRDVGTGNVHFWLLKVEDIEPLTILRDELVDARWFSINDLYRVDLFPATRRALSKLRRTCKQ